MGAALVLLLVGLGAMAAGVLIGRYYVPDDRQLRRTARHSRAYMRALSHLIARDHDTVVERAARRSSRRTSTTSSRTSRSARCSAAAASTSARSACTRRSRCASAIAASSASARCTSSASTSAPPACRGARPARWRRSCSTSPATRVRCARSRRCTRSRRGSTRPPGCGSGSASGAARTPAQREHHLLVAAAQAALGRDDLESAKQLLKAAQKHRASRAHFFAAAAELAAARGNHRGAKERLQAGADRRSRRSRRTCCPGLIAAEQGLAARRAARARRSRRRSATSGARRRSRRPARARRRRGDRRCRRAPRRRGPRSRSDRAAGRAEPVVAGVIGGETSVDDAWSGTTPPPTRDSSPAIAAASRTATPALGTPTPAARVATPPHGTPVPPARDSSPAIRGRAASQPGAARDSSSALASGGSDRCRPRRAAARSRPRRRAARSRRSARPRTRRRRCRRSPARGPTKRPGRRRSCRRRCRPAGQPARARAARRGRGADRAAARARADPRAAGAAGAMPRRSRDRARREVPRRARGPRRDRALALAGGDPATIRAALEVLVGDAGALAWALRGRWQCAHCGNRPGAFSWRCGQCRRWGTLRMETGIEPPPAAVARAPRGTARASPTALLGARARRVAAGGDARSRAHRRRARERGSRAAIAARPRRWLGSRLWRRGA